MDDDHTLLSRFAKSRDERAFTELVRRHLDLVYGVCLRRTGSRPLAEELVQNVFAALAQKAGSLKPGVSVVGWLHRAAHLESLSAFRSEPTRLRKMKNYMDHPSDSDPQPDRFRELSPFLDQALDSLPASDRDVILLRFASDLTLQQIGSQLGKSESAAQRHLQRVLTQSRICCALRRFQMARLRMPKPL
jgi:RNA polymerase sigma factor (sigma-70 family)